jgi:hypothetical protein
MAAELTDPLSTRAAEAIWSLHGLIEDCVKWRVEEPVSYLVTLQGLEQLRHSVDYPPDHYSGLDKLVDGVETLMELFSFTDAQLVLFDESRSTPKPVKELELLAQTRTEFGALYIAVKSITPLQLAVQRHFMLLGYEQLNHKFPGAQPWVFAGLASIRDRYLAQPTPELVNQYLKDAAVAVTNPAYDYWAYCLTDNTGHWARLEEAVVAIEVLSMLEATEPADDAVLILQAE